MKKLKTNILMIAALAIGAVTMSFKMATTSTLWHYVGTANPGVYTDADNWAQGSADPNTCITDGNTPCEITVDASDESQLSDYLDGLTNQDVLDINPSSRKP